MVGFLFMKINKIFGFGFTPKTEPKQKKRTGQFDINQLNFTCLEQKL